MKITYLPLFFVFGVWFLACSPQAKHITKQETQNASQKMEPNLYQMQMQMQDVSLGSVPNWRIKDAYDWALGNIPPFPPPVVNGNGCGWESKGPEGIGGRVRAMLLDRNGELWIGGIAGGLWRCNNPLAANPQWQAMAAHNWASGSIPPLAISTIAQDINNPNMMFVGTGEGWFNGDAVSGGGMWVSSNGGNTWNHAVLTNVTSANRDFDHIQKIIVTPGGSLLIATRESGLWRATYNPANGQILTLNAVLNTAATPGMNSNRIADIEVADYGAGIYDIYVTSGFGPAGGGGQGMQSDGIWVSRNSADGVLGSWTRVNIPGSGLPFGAGFGRIELAVAPSRPQTVYAMINDLNGQNFFTQGSCLGVYRSDNSGLNWTFFPFSSPSIGQAFYNLTCSVNPANHLDIITGTLDLAHSADGGLTWTTLSSRNPFLTPPPYVHADQHAIIYNQNGLEVFFANDGGIYRSPDRNTLNIFQNINTNLSITQFYAVDMGPESCDNVWIGGTQDNGNLTGTGPQLNTFNYLNQTSDGGFSFIDQDNPDVQGYLEFGAGNNFVITNDRWASVMPNTPSWVTGLGISWFVNPYTYSDQLDIAFYARGSGTNAGPGFLGRILDVGNANIHGTPAPGMSADIDLSSFVPVYANMSITALCLSPSNPTLLYVALFNPTTLQHRIISIDNINQYPNGVHNSQPGPIGNGYVTSIAVDPHVANDQHMLITISNFGLPHLLEADAGVTDPSWVPATGNLRLINVDMPFRWISFIPTDPNHVLLGTDIGLFCTDNLLPNPLPSAPPSTPSTIWREIQDVPATRIDMIDVRDDGYVTVATHGRGIYTSECFFVPPLELQVSAWLEGPFDPNTGLMTTNLTQPNLLISQSQPFGNDPWNYIEGDLYDPGLAPSNVVDWVLVELREEASDPNTIIERQAGFILDDGSIVNTEGQNFRFCDPTIDFHVILHHRNHLSIASAQQFSFGSGLIQVDFKVNGSAFVDPNATNPPQKTLPSGEMALAGGDVTFDQQINSVDLGQIFTTINNNPSPPPPGYWIEDVTLNGIVDDANSIPAFSDLIIAQSNYFWVSHIQ